MGSIATSTPAPRAAETGKTTTRDLLRVYFEGRRDLQKGICLLNAAQYAQAAEAFARAARANPDSREFADYAVSALAGARKYGEAAKEAERSSSAEGDGVRRIVQRALLQWKAGAQDEALRTLREGVAANLDSAELHFQLGTMLAAKDETEEAELRFTQAIAIDGHHADALVSLALCRGASSDPASAIRHMERAQQLRPHDARVNLMLVQCVRAARDAGVMATVRAEMPGRTDTPSVEAVERLGVVIDRDPEFVEAFLSLEPEEVDPSVFNLLVQTLKQAIERNPHLARLHYLSGKVLERLERHEEAIEAAERAVDIDPRYVKALILLAVLYRQTDRLGDATARLEETVRLGAEYADTYYLLGNLYRDRGHVERARWAYRNALRINQGYEAARVALETLAA